MSPLDWLRRAVARIPRVLRRPPPEGKVVHPRRFPTAAQWRMLPTVFPPVEWRIVRLVAALAVVGFVVGTGALLAAHVRLVPHRGGSLTEVMVGSPQYVNPLLATGNPADEALVRLVYAGLFGHDADGTLVPVLAEDGTMNDAHTVFTVHLRPNLAWPDGEPFTPDDVLTTVDVLQDARYRLTIPNRLKGVTVERADERTLTFTLPTANPLFPHLLTFGVLPAHLWANVDATKFALVEYNLKPIGMGPFRFNELRRDGSGQVRSYTLERNPAWPLEPTYLDRFTLRFVTDADTASQEITERAAEAFATDVPTDVHGVRRGTQLRVPLTQYVAVFLNERGDVLKDPAVRHALDVGTDRTALAALTPVAGRPVADPVLPGTPGVPDPTDPTFDRDLAERILDENGWKREDGGARAKGQTKLAVTLTTVEDPAYDAVAAALKAQWEALGAVLTIETVDTPRFPRETLRTRQYSALLFAEQVGFDGDLYPFWHSTQERDPGLNLSTFFRKDMDAALDRYRAAKDDAGRTAALTEFRVLFQDERPAIVLYQPQLLYAAPRSLGGLSGSRAAVSADRFNGASGWYVQRRPSWQ